MPVVSLVSIQMNKYGYVLGDQHLSVNPLVSHLL